MIVPSRVSFFGCVLVRVPWSVVNLVHLALPTHFSRGVRRRPLLVTCPNTFAQEFFMGEDRPDIVPPVISPAELAEILQRFGSKSQKRELAACKTRSSSGGVQAPGESGDRNVSEAVLRLLDLLSPQQPSAGNREQQTGRDEGRKDGDPHVFIFDASWTYLPMFGGRDGLREYNESARLPHAVFFDIEECSDTEQTYPHMMPGSVDFAFYLERKAREYKARMHAVPGNKEGSAPVQSSSKVASAEADPERDIFVVYDGVGLFAAPRVYFMLTVFGCKNAFALDGGIKRWIAEGYPIETGPLSDVVPSEDLRRSQNSQKGEGEETTAVTGREKANAGQKAGKMIQATAKACTDALKALSLHGGKQDSQNRGAESPAPQSGNSQEAQQQNVVGVSLDTSQVVEYENILSMLEKVKTGDDESSAILSDVDDREDLSPDRVAAASIPGVPLLVDARLPGRFKGEQPEPRPCVPSGHIPTSMNLPFTEVVHIHRYTKEKDGAAVDHLSPFSTSTDAPFAYHTLRRGTELKQALDPVLRRAGDCLSRSGDSTKNDKKIILTCGSGMTACILYVALVQAGVRRDCMAVYDGSWAEYAERRLLEARGEGICPALSEEQAGEWKKKIMESRASGSTEELRVPPGETIAEAVA